MLASSKHSPRTYFSGFAAHWARWAYLPLFTLLLGCTSGCGSGQATLSTVPLEGAYEFVITSNLTGSTTLVEANLRAGQNQSNASGPSQVQIVARENKNWYVNGICFTAAPGQNSVAATVSGNNVNVTFNEGGNTFSGQGVVAGTSISGNYSVTGSDCPDLQNIIGVPAGSDSGGFTAVQVPELGGTFAGPLNLPGGPANTSLTLSEDSNQALTVGAVLNSPGKEGNFVFSGSAVGNVMFVSGSVNGTEISLFGYFDRAGRFTGTPNTIQVFDYDTLTNIGLLIKQN